MQDENYKSCISKQESTTAELQCLNTKLQPTSVD